jgi:purine-binding chemotaxis protein CheW
MPVSNEKADPPSPSRQLAQLAATARTTTGREDGRSDTTAAREEISLALLFMRVGRRWFAVKSETVREVGTKGYVTRVPTAPTYVLGVTLIRGRLVPVLALEGLLGALGTGETAQTLPRLVVLRHGDTEIALVADETKGIVERKVEAHPESQTRAAERPRYLGEEFDWEGKLVCMIDVPALIADATPGGPQPS